MVQINFGSGFVSDDARKWTMRRDAAMLAHFVGLEPDTEARREFRDTYATENPYPFATVDTVLDHIDRAVALAGIDHVGLGSDFDGVGDTLPIGLKNFGDFPNLVSGLLERLRRGRHREDLGSEPDARLAGGGAVRRPARLRVEVLSKCHHVASTTRKRVRNTPIAR